MKKEEDQEFMANKALEVIGKLNFEKACKIMCDGIADRWPRLVERIKDLEGLTEIDRKRIEEFEGLTKDEIAERIRERVYLKRDSIVDAYDNVFAKIDAISVDPEFTKAQSRDTIYSNILGNEHHFKTLRQYPSDWNNDDLFGTLWGYSRLVIDWSINTGIKKTTKDDANQIAQLSRFDKQILWIKNHKILSFGILVFPVLIWLADVSDALVRLGIFRDNTIELQRQEFFNNNLPQFDLWYSAFYPENRDPLLKETLLDDTVGITGSYRLINTGRAIITLEKINLPEVFSIRGYFSDRIVELPYSLSPGDTIVISCELYGKELPITETEKALKRNVSLICSYPAANIRFTYKFHWHDGLFRKERIIVE